MKVLKEHRRILAACVIGDGHLTKDGRFSVFHSEKQYDYVIHKYQLLKPLVTSSGIRKRESNNTIQYGFSCRSTKFTKYLRRLIYPMGTKQVNLKLLNKFSVQELAIWWMDDGSCSVKRNKKTKKIEATVSTLSTQLSKDENQIIIDWIFNTFGVKFGQRKMKNQFALICGTKEGRKLATIIDPFIIDSMKYKLSK